MLKEYQRSIKALGWTIAGLIVSLSIINAGRFSVFGYPLLVLSILMALLTIKIFLEEKRQLSNQKKKR
ncbi:MAG: hypothetical protein Q8Q31_00850 [Nanoarchaeota archaeon]|nr:hypothetical protein [Nanoarchaeota archaeon]